MFHVVGFSHHEAPLATRERLAFSATQREAALEAFLETYPGSEVVILSTCNRVEIYVAGTCPSAYTERRDCLFLVAISLACAGGIRVVPGGAE